MIYPQLSEIGTIDPDDLVVKLHRILDGLVTGHIPGHDVTIEKLEMFLLSLVESQRGPGQFIVWGGNWSLISTDESAPSDVRVSYVYFPSYLVVSILSYCRFTFEALVSSIENYEDVLLRGLHFISARQLNGHGIDGENEKLEAVRILLKGKVDRLITNNSSHCKKCETLYRSLTTTNRWLMSCENRTLVMDRIIEGLKDIPAFGWRADNGLSWLKGENERVCLEFCAGIELLTKPFVPTYFEKITIKTGCSIMHHNLSHEQLTHNFGEGGASHLKETYQEAIKEIYPSEQADSQLQYHIVVGSQSLEVLGESDIKVSGGFNCDEKLLETIAWNLKVSMEGYSRRECRVLCEVLDEDCEPFNRLVRLYGSSLAYVQVIFRDTLLKIEPDRIGDSLVYLINRLGNL